MITETFPHQEFYKDGQLWISGTYGVVPNMWQCAYKCMSIPERPNELVCRIGIWTTYYNNGQLAWAIDYGDGTYDYKSNLNLPSYRRDGTLITHF